MHYYVVAFIMIVKLIEILRCSKRGATRTYDYRHSVHSRTSNVPYTMPPYLLSAVGARVGLPVASDIQCHVHHGRVHDIVSLRCM